jgi:hypothetical protein
MFAEDRVALTRLLLRVGAPTHDIAAAVRIVQNVHAGIYYAKSIQKTMRVIFGLNVTILIFELLTRLPDLLRAE